MPQWTLYISIVDSWSRNWIKPAHYHKSFLNVQQTEGTPADLYIFFMLNLFISSSCCLEVTWLRCTFVSDAWCEPTWTETLESLTNDAFTFVRWTSSSGQALLHSRSFCFCIGGNPVGMTWVRKELCQNAAEIQHFYSCPVVTHCAGGRLRWSYCEFINCPPRPRPLPQVNYETASHGFILYSPISYMKTKKSFLVQCGWWL